MSLEEKFAVLREREQKRSLGAEALRELTPVPSISEAEEPAALKARIAELERLRLADRDSAAELIHTMQGRIIELEQEKREERKRADTDALTGLSNRAGFEEQYDVLLKSHIEPSPEHPERRSPREFINMIVLDLNGFKAINDHYGHLAGDAAIRHVADVLRSTLRDTDAIARADDFIEEGDGNPAKPGIGRLGGDEFMIFFRNNPLPSEHNLHSLVTVAERVHDALEDNPFIWKTPSGKEVTIPVSGSIGGAQRRGHESYQELFARADSMAMLAKKRGKHGSVTAKKSVAIAELEETDIEELERASRTIPPDAQPISG